MSLSTLLLGSKASKKKKSIDAGLDDLFKVTQPTGAQGTSTTSTNVMKKKRALQTSSQSTSKKQKRTSSPPQRQPTPPEEESESGAQSDSSASVSLKQGKGSDDASEGSESEPDEDAMDVDEDHDADGFGDASMDASGAEGVDEDAVPPVHETLQKTKPIATDARSRKERFVPPGETAEQRSSRTIFVGNLPKDVAQKRPLQKQLHKHILSLVPTAKIESSRFRSVAFQVPTSKLPDDSAKPTPTKARQHDKDRAASWRTSSGKDDEKADEKKFLTPAQKKKIAFINQQFHPIADSVNAYIVFAHPIPASSRPSNLPPLPPVLEPYKAARVAVEKCNGTIFMERMIRVDAAAPLSSDASLDKSHATGAGDPRLTIFVGNLDFESKEDDLRVFFEGLVSSERGPPPSETAADSNAGQWVNRVRIVRDGQTQLGKGFAYVQFADRVCVDEILAMDVSRLKFAKRKLRVQRCKTAPAASPRDAPAGKMSIGDDKLSKPTRPSKADSMPKGDPNLGSKLAHLSKEERKKVKATDSDRRARRLAKKKAGNALSAKDASHAKDRERARKQSTMKKSAPAHFQKKGRVRSEKSVAKRNVKK